MTMTRVVCVVAGLAGLACEGAKTGKRSESSIYLKKIAQQARMYYADTPQPRDGVVVPQFPGAAPLSPSADCCAQGGKCMPNRADWEDPSWRALSFSIDEPYHFQYEFRSSGSGPTAEFTARAVGDPECHGTPQVREITGKVVGGEVKTSGP